MAGRIILFGATGYTGRLTADAFARRGVKPALAGRSPESLDRLSSELGGHSAPWNDPRPFTSSLEPGRPRVRKRISSVRVRH